MTWNEIAAGKYALLTTYKKDGTPVSTPVWVAPDGARMVVWTHPNTGKVKRIRRTAEVTVQRCDPRGNIEGDEIVAGRAEILDADGTERVREVVSGKYRFAGRLAIRAHKLWKGPEASVGVAITPEAGADTG